MAGMLKSLQQLRAGKKDSGFFSTTKKGEVVEWGEAIRSSDKLQKKDGIKRVIAAMTVGKDVSSLFGDVVKCMQVSAAGDLRPPAPRRGISPPFARDARPSREDPRRFSARRPVRRTLVPFCRPSPRRAPSPGRPGQT